jgi:hypothetical protein
LISSIRRAKGAIPVHIPLLLFLYTIVFIVAVEFVMLFWLHSSLNTAARQIAFRAATNNSFQIQDAAGRCRAAAERVGGVFPGYSGRVRRDFIDAVVNGGKAGFGTFDEVQQEGALRQTLAGMGAARPDAFWGGSLISGPGNLRFGGCYGVQDPTTNQITYHAVVHCSGCWPIFLKGLFSGLQGGAVSFSGWLEGRGSYSASQAGTADSVNLNKSLLSSGPRPFLVCNENGCDMTNGGDQNSILPNAQSGSSVCQPFAPQEESRPAPNQVKSANSPKVFAIDQWPAERQALCTRCDKCHVSLTTTKTSKEYCKGSDPNPSGITRVANCGDIDEGPLYFVGLRYACMGVDAFGRIMKIGVYEEGNSAEFIGRCDHYVMFKPSCNTGVAPMDKIVGDVTNLDGNRGPCIIRRNNLESSQVKIVCRNDSKMIMNFWDGPYTGGPPQAEAQFKDNIDKNSLAGKSIPGGSSSSTEVNPQGALDSPLDMAMPYHQLCDICNPGSPMCGKYGTCRNKSNLWTGAKTVHQFQVWTNTPFYNVNPMYGQLECKYQRDCMERHCCADAPDLEGYCASRTPIVQMAFGKSCQAGINTWTYKGVPNRTPQAHTPTTLPRQGGFPHCSSGAVQVFKHEAGECCTTDVATASLPCGVEPAPVVFLTPPNMNCASCLRDCTGKKNNRFCPAKGPKMEGNCLVDPYPIGGECMGGPGGSPGSPYSPMPADSPATASMCDDTPNQPPGIRENCVTNSKSSTQGSTVTDTVCKTCTKCSPTPIVLSFEKDFKPEFTDQESCFALNQNRMDLGFSKLKGNKTYGFLVIDLNHNGKIDDGRELFGNWTNDRYNIDGYAALSTLKDTNQDGLVKGKELEGLLLWQDLNNDSVSQKEELKSIKSFGIVELDSGLLQVSREQILKYFDADKRVYSSRYSPKGFKYKITKDNKTEIKYGSTWDITYAGVPSANCLKQNEKFYKLNPFQVAYIKLNHYYKTLIGTV